MRLSNYFISTLREAPAEAEVISHKLMIRAGLLMQVAAGIYNYLPLGLRVLQKIEAIVRTAMNEAGAIELLMPAMVPKELWVESGRWEKYGKELLRIRDRNDREFCFGPTHEEVITDIVRKHIKSYKSLPINLYQIQTKFRDEIRPRFGLMRAREFIMKDAYSFDANEEGAKISYEKMYRAYQNIFDRLGLRYKIVEADTGAIGGTFSHEFMVLANSGEDTIIYCKNCGYSANLEKAALKENQKESKELEKPLEKISTPNIKTVQDVSEYLNVGLEKIVKTLILKAKDFYFAVLISGEHELNLTKVKNNITETMPDFASQEEIERLTGGPVGFSGPIGLNIPVYADYSVKGLKNFVIGANERDTHYINANTSRDFIIEHYYDLRYAKKGDLCINCNSQYESMKGIETGHIFKLGTKYSEALKAYFSDRDGKLRPYIMGCYGIGIGRIASASIEQNHDEKGIIWPIQIAPFEVVIIPINTNDTLIVETAESIYKKLKEQNVDVAIDDRDYRAGVKFNDADLIGYPIRINVGKKAMEKNEVEIYIRSKRKAIFVKYDKLFEKLFDIIEQLKENNFV
ncbi:MAG: proline--tRNA ligase [Deferribacterota bacterium]|nr:proline--tRNA ligase [Deferribacterota bacterium]